MRSQVTKTGKTTPSSVVTQEERLTRLQALDLTNVKRKLMESYPEGKGWTEAQVREAEKWYRRYLQLIIVAPKDVALVPNGPIDTFWHQHILDTRAYATDCAHIFGEFIHHFPYYGMNGDAPERDNSFVDTNALYREHFGEDCTAMQLFAGTFAEKCGAEKCSSDGAPCKRDSQLVCEDRGNVTEQGMSCNSSGSGTGCSQGCKRIAEPELAGTIVNQAETCKQCGSCRRGQ